jgi:hypothetical protein
LMERFLFRLSAVARSSKGLRKHRKSLRRKFPAFATINARPDLTQQ